jgi:hypothetical protein
MTHRVFQTGHAHVRRLLWLIVVLLATQAYPQSAGPEFPNPGNAHMSRDKQRALGLQAAAQVYQQMPVLPDNSPETQYIRQLGQKLVATIPPEHSWPFEFHVVAQKEINAFALCGNNGNPFIGFDGREYRVHIVQLIVQTGREAVVITDADDRVEDFRRTGALKDNEARACEICDADALRGYFAGSGKSYDQGLAKD